MADQSQLITLAAAGTVHNTASTVTGAGVLFRQPYSQAQVELQVTAAATGVGDTLDVFVDTSFDGGATWVNIGHFTQVLGNGGTKKFLMSFMQTGQGATAVQDMTVDAAAGATREIGLGDRLRYRSTVAASGAFTFGITAFCKE